MRIRFPTLSRRPATSAALVIAAVVLIVPLSGQERFPFEPFDEAAGVPPLLAVRSALIDAIQRHDVQGVGRLLSPDFEPKSGGPQAALEAFGKWPEFFRDLVTTLAFGGGFTNAEKTRFCAPFWYARPVQEARYPRDLAPTSGYPFIVMFPNVPVFERPDRQSQILGYVGLELIRLADNDAPSITSPEEALQAEAANREDRLAARRLAEVVFHGKKAYIDSSVLRNPDETFNYACFERRDGNWLLSEFGPK